MPICFNCNNIVDNSSKKCPFCGASYNNIKDNFIKYIGPKDSLVGYQKSYKLVLLKFIIESLDDKKQAEVSSVIEKIRLFYLNRVNNGLLADVDVDDRIKNIQNSNNYDVFAVMKSQPFKVINDKGFLFLNRNENGNLVFVFHEDLSSSLSLTEFDKILTILNEKLSLYYQSKLPSIIINSKESDNLDVQYNFNSSTNENLNTIIDSIDFFRTSSKNALKKRGIYTVNDIIEFDKLHGYSTLKLLGNSVFGDVSNLIIKTTLSKNHNVNMCCIRHVFHENSWNSFIRFCISKHYNYIGDLNGFDFDSLLLEKGFGLGKIEKIKERYFKFVKQYSTNNFDLIFNQKNQYKERLTIHNSNKSLSVKSLKLVGFSEKQIKSLLESGYNTIGKLENMSNVELMRIIGKYKIEEIFKSLKQFADPLIDIATKILLGFKCDREFRVYIMRSEGFSLQEIADDNNCSRERVRQIESRFDRKISPIISSIIENYFSENKVNYISANDILEFFDDDDLDKVIMYNLKKSDKYEYLPFAELFLKKSSSNQNTVAALYALAKDFVGDGIDLFSELDNLDDMLSNAGYDYLDADAFLNLLEECNAQFYGDYVVFGKKSYAFLCCKIIEEYFPNGIKLYSESEIEKLKELTRQKFGNIDFPDNIRAISSAISRNLIISDRGKANSINNIHFEYDTIQTIKEYIDNNVLNTLYYREIFSEFEGLLAITSDINNYHCLHGVLQYCYPEDYYYSRDKLSKKDGIGIKLSLEDRINDFITTSGHAVHKKEIIENIGGCSEAMLFNVAVKGNKVIIWDYCYYNSIYNLHYSEEEKLNLKNLLLSLLDDNSGYCSDGLLFNNVKKYFPEFLEKNFINNRTNLFYVVSYLFGGDFRFSRPHICSSNFPVNINAKEIILYLMGNKDIILHSEFISIAKKMFWSEMTCSLGFSEIEEKSVRISDDKYIKEELFNVDPESLKTISETLDSLCNELNVISTINLVDFSLFPNIQYEWNSHLLVSIIEKYDIGYKIINPKIRDRRYQKSIIIKDNSSCSNLDDVVVKYLKANEISEISESNLLSFLIINGLVRKIIPKELYESSVLNYKNGKFYI